MTKPLKVDSLDRVKFTERTQTPNPDFEPDERHLYAMEFIHRHTMVASNILYELMRFTTGTKHKDNFYDFLRVMFDGMMLERPMSQRYTEQPDGNFHVYRLTPRGERALIEAEKWSPVVKHSGPFPHQLMGATYTATIDIMCRRTEGYRFVPAHEFLDGKEKKVSVPFDWHGKRITDTRYIKLDPDYIHGIQYGERSFMSFLPEFNRSSEPYVPTSDFTRRSDLKTIMQWEEFIGKQLYKEAYGRQSRLIPVFVTTTAGEGRITAEERAQSFIDLAKAHSKTLMTAAVLPTFESPFKPPHFPEYLFEKPLYSTHGEFTIKKPA